MRKRKRGRRLSLKTDQRKALLRSLASSLFLKEKITTTYARAKELAIFAEKQITRAKIGDLSGRRRLAEKFSENIVKKLIKEFALRYKERKGGYTRIINLGPRKSDGAKMAIIELIK
ncbi:MAG: 50S ribosomal protein L17 [bacterium]